MAGINENIASFRKKKGVTQEGLGRALGVSMQAVSRWENGGTPDTMLLPALADYLGASIDELFGREAGGVQAETAILQRLSGVPREEAMETAFKLMWEVQRGLSGEKNYHGDGTFNRWMKGGQFTHSRMMFDNGVSEMRLGKSHSWYFISPDPEDGRRAALYDREGQTKLFRLLSEPDAYDALFIVLQRDRNPFTAKLIEKSLNIPTGRAVEILRSFEEFRLVYHSTLELDDEQITIYNVPANIPYVIPFLTFADEMVHQPQAFNYNFGGRDKPYITSGKEEKT